MSTNSENLHFRQAREDDWLQILEIETQWKRWDVSPITKEIFHTWLDIHPEGFLVAEQEGKIQAHMYLLFTNFKLSDIGRTPDWYNPFVMDCAMPKHYPEGNCIFALNLIARPSTGIGIQLAKEGVNFGRRKGKQYLICIPRMLGLSRYWKKCQGGIADHLSVEDIARFYAVQCMYLANVQVATALAEKTSMWKMPTPQWPDTVISHFAKHLGMTLHEIIPSCYIDPQSMNLAGLLIKEA